MNSTWMGKHPCSIGNREMDTVTREQRSEIMRRVRSRDTRPEMMVRRTLHRMGYRFRLHNGRLPGRPDLVLTRWKVVVFINGCFWHQHAGCPKAARPTTNEMFWNRKLDRNLARDQENVSELRKMGWRVLVLWECKIRDERWLQRRLQSFLRE